MAEALGAAEAVVIILHLPGPADGQDAVRVQGPGEVVPATVGTPPASGVQAGLPPPRSPQVPLSAIAASLGAARTASPGAAGSRV